MKKIISSGSYIIALFFIVYFCYAVVAESRNFTGFRNNWSLAPGLQAYGGRVAYLLLTVQSAIVLLLCWRVTRIIGFASVATFLIFFTAYIGSLLMSGKNLPCTCLGIIEGLTWKQNLVVSLALLLLALIGLIQTVQNGKKREHSDEREHALG